MGIGMFRRHRGYDDRQIVRVPAPADPVQRLTAELEAERARSQALAAELDKARAANEALAAELEVAERPADLGDPEATDADASIALEAVPASETTTPAAPRGRRGGR